MKTSAQFGNDHQSLTNLLSALDILTGVKKHKCMLSQFYKPFWLYELHDRVAKLSILLISKLMAALVCILQLFVFPALAVWISYVINSIKWRTKASISIAPRNLWLNGILQLRRIFDNLTPDQFEPVHCAFLHKKIEKLHEMVIRAMFGFNGIGCPWMAHDRLALIPPKEMTTKRSRRNHQDSRGFVVVEAREFLSFRGHTFIVSKLRFGTTIRQHFFAMVINSWSRLFYVDLLEIAIR